MTTLFKAFKQKKYVYAVFPDSVITYAAKGNLSSIPMSESTNGLSVNSRWRYLESGAFEFSHFFAITKKINDEEIKGISNGAVKHVNYDQWLSADAMRVGYLSKTLKIESLTISREMLMKRIANTLGGSHLPAGSGSNFDGGEKAHKFDMAIQNAMQYQIAGLPIPYLILLKIAQDILMVAERKGVK